MIPCRSDVRYGANHMLNVNNVNNVNGVNWSTGTNKG